jgi:hypothetical protein
MNEYFPEACWPGGPLADAAIANSAWAGPRWTLVFEVVQSKRVRVLTGPDALTEKTDEMSVR